MVGENDSAALALAVSAQEGIARAGLAWRKQVSFWVVWQVIF
jgi:hypothetical protein